MFRAAHRGNIRFRHLCQNPYGSEASHFSFEDQVQFAIEASMRAGRVIGVIHFQLNPLLDMHSGPHDAEAQDAIEIAAEAFRSRVRRTDHVEILNSREIAVFISLLAGQVDLKNIASRLRSTSLPFKDCALSVPGLAIYPLHGYGAGELLTSARMQSVQNNLPQLAAMG